MTVRVYFNAKADAPRVWSVDTGPGTTEHRVADVDGMFQCGGARVTHYRPEADNVTEPRAWIEFRGVELEIRESIALIYSE